MRRKEDEEAKERDRRCRARKIRRTSGTVVAPNTGAGGSHPRATTDPEEEGRKEKGEEVEGAAVRRRKAKPGGESGH